MQVDHRVPVRFFTMPVELPTEVAPCSPEADDAAVMPHVYKEELARALDIICRDSRTYPDRYLQETTVPHGGE
jgi:hypothetical protein